MRTLCTAVVGAGRIGWMFHIPEAIRHDGFDLVAVVDPLQARLDEVEAQFGVKGYLDYAQLLDSEKLDLVVIASPTHLHADQAVAAFERGCDVFCDKPMAPTLEQVDRMIAAMKTHGRKLMVYQPHRATAETVALREILGRDLIGPVYMIKRAWVDYQRRNDWQAFQKHGGGMLNNYGAHVIDLLLHLSGSRAGRITCSLRTVASLGDADDVAKIMIDTEDGTVLDLDINMASAQAAPRWHVLGKHGSILFDETEQAWHVRYYLPEELAPIELYTQLAAPDRRYGSGETIPWQEQIIPLSDFQPINVYQKCYEYFAKDSEPFVPVDETREVMRVLDACRKSAGKGPLRRV
jgi:scyllo-inositol 2-dehydrogenase (NADP+)